MDLRNLQAKLLKAARANPPSEAVPYAFEQRIMARLRSARPQDTWAFWSQALWRAAVVCLLVTLVSGVWSVWSGAQQSSQVDFSQEFERAIVLAAESELEESW